jgi:hypothetical protein
MKKVIELLIGAEKQDRNNFFESGKEQTPQLIGRLFIA